MIKLILKWVTSTIAKQIIGVWVETDVFLYIIFGNEQSFAKDNLCEYKFLYVYRVCKSFSILF